MGARKNYYDLNKPLKLQKGVYLIEVLISLLIIAISLLGLAGLQARANNAEFESYQRSQAIMLATDMVERIKMNRKELGAFKNINGFVGTNGTGAYSLDCSAPNSQFSKDMCAWSDLLQGSAEKNSLGNYIGSVIDARGCISYDASTEYNTIADTGIFTVAVAWQGTNDTVTPTNLCGSGLYGAETKRRVISLAFRLGKLS
ncbi:MAG: hypothetical protein RLZZ591_1405 [Pseudomonadota bacterium]|jgi:type IV pilus assembly protein PilV